MFKKRGLHITLLLLFLIIICTFTSGEILFQENFEDTNFQSRGWYDHLSGEITTEEHINGSNSSLICKFNQDTTSCEGGVPGRHKFPETSIVYLSYWVKYSQNFIGSGVDYHPHEFHFITNTTTSGCIF